MPFKTCPACGKGVRTIDPNCWNCEHIFDEAAFAAKFRKPSKASEAATGFGCILALGVVLVGAYSLVPSCSSTGPDRGDPYADELKQYAWIRVSKNALKEKLKDPPSARFRNVRFYSGGGTPVVCGEVNARNSFGGYGGYERFIAAGSTMAFLESEVSDGLDSVWDRMCVRAPKDSAYEN